MQRRNLIILGAAVLFGLMAVFLANTYFSSFEKQEERAAKQEQLARIVVASQVRTPVIKGATRRPAPPE